MKRNIRIPLTAAALTLLLAACGGGGGSSEKAVSSSPSTSNTSVTVNTTAGSGSEAGASAGSNNSSTGTGTTSNGADTGSTSGSGSSSTGSGTATDSGSNSANATGNTASGTSADSGAAAGNNTTNSGGTSASADAGTTAAGGTTSGETTGSTTADTPAITPPTVALISETGIRGDVFLGMLEQMPCGHDWIDSAQGPDGSNLSDGLEGMNAHTSLGNYQMNPNYPVGGYSNAMGCNGKSYVPVEAGNHTYTISNSIFAKFYRPNRGFHHLTVQVPVTITDSAVTLGKDLKTSVFLTGWRSPEETWPAEWKTYQAPTLHADSDFTVNLNANVPYGTLKQWTEANPADPSKQQYETLMLIKGDAANQAKLCWNTDLTYVKRLQCIIWEVPADWTPRTQLKVVDQTMVEDRSAYPNETGFAYWN